MVFEKGIDFGIVSSSSSLLLTDLGRCDGDLKPSNVFEKRSGTCGGSNLKYGLRF